MALGEARLGSPRTGNSQHARFGVIPRWWVVERTFGCMIDLAMGALLLRYAARR